MQNIFNYDKFLNQAFVEIKQLRDPKSISPEYNGIICDEVKKNRMFDFLDEEFIDNAYILRVTTDISNKYLSICILELFDFYGIPLEVVKTQNKEYMFIGYEKKNKVVLIFKKNIECSSMILKKDYIPEYADEIMKKYKTEKCKIVYYLFDKAYMQVFNYDDKTTDLGRGYNLYSLIDIVKEYFGKEESKRLYATVSEFKEKVKNYLSISLVKGLSPNVIVNFRRIIENRILTYNYKKLLTKNYAGNKLERKDYELLYDRFIKKQLYKVLLSDNDFSESLITAEWMYISMKDAKAVDLTIIGLGYIKCVEQLLFNLICFHKNENKKIGDKNKKYEVDDELISNKLDIFSIGNMAHFYEDYLNGNLLVAMENPTVIKKSIFCFANIRNGYFHKHNIHDWNIIDEMLDETYLILFLLIGSKKDIENKTPQLGVVDEIDNDDFNKLCEYVDYYAGTTALFIFNYNGEELPFFAVRDTKAELINNRFVKYSGVYFKPPVPRAKILYYDKNTIPNEIYIGKFKMYDKDRISLDFSKDKMIYKNGSFIASLVQETESLSF